MPICIRKLYREGGLLQAISAINLKNILQFINKFMPENLKNSLNLYFKKTFSKQNIIKELKHGLFFLTLIISILFWAGLSIFVGLLPTIYGDAVNQDLTLKLFYFVLLSPVFFYILFNILNKEKRKKYFEEIKSFTSKSIEVIKWLVYSILILLGIIIFFSILGVFFSWLIGLGVATLLVILILVILFK